MSSLQTISTPLTTVTKGERGDVLLFIHGFPMNNQIWEHQIAILSEQYRCIAPDLPGYGSTLAEEHFVPSIENFAEILYQFIESRELAPAHIVGVSMGGMIAMNLARRYPHVTKSLLLFHTSAEADSPAAIKERSAVIADIERNGAEDFVSDFANLLLSPNTPDNIRTCFVSMLREASAATVISGLRALRDRRDQSPWLHEINIPAFVIAGEDDERTTPAHMRELAKRIPDAKFDVILNSGHVSPIEAPNACTKIIQGWLEMHRN